MLRKRAVGSTLLHQPLAFGSALSFLGACSPHCIGPLEIYTCMHLPNLVFLVERLTLALPLGAYCASSHHGHVRKLMVHEGQRGGGARPFLESSSTCNAAALATTTYPSPPQSTLATLHRIVCDDGQHPGC